ncbi:MAG: hypothetical protein LAT83_21500, partial [Kiritimatiellae bacterium]|nr:hypothetical protein [Kiritimatiellia bacterium]
LTIVFQVLYSMHRLMFLISINREYVFLGRMQIKYMENAASVTKIVLLGILLINCIRKVKEIKAIFSEIPPEKLANRPDR